MKYLLMIYRDEKVWEALSSAEKNTIELAGTAHEQAQRASGRLMDVTHLPDQGAAITFRLIDNHPVFIKNANEARSEQLTSLVFIDAKDLNEAIQIAITMPQARVGPIAVRSIQKEKP